MAALFLRGHGLVAEGAAFTERKHRIHWNTIAGEGFGLCACGALSDRSLPNGAQRRSWHARHKREILAGRVA